MKTVKRIGKIILWVVGAAVVLVLTLPLWIGVVKPIANTVVSSKTGTDFHLGVFGLNPYTGRLAVGDMQLQNPAGCSQKMAATLGNLCVDVDMGTVASDTIVIQEIAIKDVFVSYVKNDKGEYNFDVIARNASGGNAETSKKDEKKPEKQESAKKDGAEKPAKKVIIDHLVIENVLVQWGPVPLPLPNIELNGIGRKSNGASMEEIWKEISDTVMKSLASVGKSAGVAFDALGNMTAESTKAVSDATAKSVDAVNGLTKKSVDAVSDATTKSAKAVGEATGAAVDAVSDTAGAAVNAVKGLFK